MGRMQRRAGNRDTGTYSYLCVCCVFSSHLFWTSGVLDVPAGVTQEDSHTGFLVHLPSVVLALIFLARRIHPFFPLSTVKSIFFFFLISLTADGSHHYHPACGH